MIILHHSLTKDSKTVSWPAIRRYHKHVLGWEDIGYHYGIELIEGEYEILIGRFEGEQGAHTKGYNFGSIGICMVGNFDLFPPIEDQRNIALVLCRDILKRCGWKKDMIFGHSEFAPWKSCPGKEFDMVKFRKDI